MAAGSTVTAPPASSGGSLAGRGSPNRSGLIPCVTPSSPPPSTLACPGVWRRTDAWARDQVLAGRVRRCGTSRRCGVRSGSCRHAKLRWGSFRATVMPRVRRIAQSPRHAIAASARGAAVVVTSWVLGLIGATAIREPRRRSAQRVRRRTCPAGRPHATAPTGSTATGSTRRPSR